MTSKPRVSESELAGEIANLEQLRLNPTGLSTREAYVLLALYELSNRRAFETPGNPWPEYTNAVGDAGYQYMQRCDGRISSGFFYWHELWDVLNLAAAQGSPEEPTPVHHMKQETVDWHDVVTEMGSRFTSLNPNPVERATIRRHEWEAILQKLHDMLPLVDFPSL